MMDKEKVLNELAEAWGMLPQQENELTSGDILQYFSEQGFILSLGYIQRKLKTLADQKMLQYRIIMSSSGGGNTKAYSPVNGKTWEDVLQYIKKK